MKRSVLGALCAVLLLTGATWNLYRGTSIVKPRLDYPSLEACIAARPEGPGSFDCRSSTDEAVSAPPDHSHSGPVIQTSAIPRANVGFSEIRIAPTSARFAQQSAPDGGAFRVVCAFSHMNFDDFMVYPGQPKMAHLHTYFGNTSANANSTLESLLQGSSTCFGGGANRSAYWMPSVIDGQGKPRKPNHSNFYYKRPYGSGGAPIAPMPPGLRYIVGDANNTDPKKTAGRFLCYGPKGENPGWKSTLTAAVRDGTCVPGGEFVIEVAFPVCWDGVNHDSPNHKAHIVNQLNRPGTSVRACPPSHPVLLPSYSFNAKWDIVAGDDLSQWRLSSDRYDKSLDAGLSIHADAVWIWDVPTMKAIVDNCLNAYRDCHNHLLGDGRTLLPGTRD